MAMNKTEYEFRKTALLEKYKRDSASLANQYRRDVERLDISLRASAIPQQEARKNAKMEKKERWLTYLKKHEFRRSQAYAMRTRGRTFGQIGTALGVTAGGARQMFLREKRQYDKVHSLSIE